MHSITPFLLVVDDDPDDQEMLVEYMTQLDPSLVIKCFGSGIEMLDFLSASDVSELPKMLLLDYSMPVLNGAEVLEAMALIPKYQAIQKIIWSTSDNQAYVHKCLSNGAERYFKKPSSLDELISIGGFIAASLTAGGGCA